MAITFKEIEAVDNGAQFFDVDLHVHSFGGSHDVKDSTMTVEAIIDEAVNRGIRILAITDHNVDTNTEKSVAYAQKYTGQILVIPGIEISTANGHLLAYFPPADAANVRNLLAKANIVGKPGDKDAHTAMSMADVIKEAEHLRGICIAAHIDRTKNGFETSAPGYPNWKKDILVSSGLYGLEFDDSANLIWYSDADEPTSNGAERKRLLAARAKAVIGRPSLAHVQGSDAHSMKEFCAGRAGKLLTRLKVNELTYEAFRTALTDPEARVRPVATIPRSIPRILGMQITAGFLDGETYHFSDNLNCFIGGRGTGKSSARQSLAYGLGISDELALHNNCPGTIIVYCEDENGIRYRYERVRGGQPVVKAKDEGDITDVPRDAFRVEYYPQGELSAVAKDPLKNPMLLQQFLDRHLLLADLLAKEQQLVSVLEQNSAQLVPLEGSIGQLPKKKETLAEINKKLAIAEQGKLKEIAAEQNQLSNERNLATALGQIRDEYKRGLTLSTFLRDYTQHEAATKPLTNDPDSNAALVKIKTAIEDVNAFLEQKEGEIKTKFDGAAKEITSALSELKQAEKQLEAKLNLKITALQQKGLSGNIAELQILFNQKSSLIQEITRINNQQAQLAQSRKQRQDYLKELGEVRVMIAQRRKDQLKSINDNLAATIQDYVVFVHYDPSGIIDEFKEFILEKMHGTYFQDETAEQFCSRITPPILADLVLKQDISGLSTAGGVDFNWARQICEKLRYYSTLHALEVMWKAPCPIITAKTNQPNQRIFRSTSYPTAKSTPSC